MSAKVKAGQETSNIHAEEVRSGGVDSVQNDQDAEIIIASARNMPRPTTNLSSPPKGKLGKCVISLLADAAAVPSLEEVDRINKAGQAKTPVGTVIQAILAKAGGSMPLEDLAPEVRKYWNRTFPTSPYSAEEFVYVIVKNSDNIRSN